MLRQSHWKTQIEGLTKQRFVQVSVHRARVCKRSKTRDKCRIFLHFFSCLEPSTSSPHPQSKGSLPLPQDPLPIERVCGIKRPRVRFFLQSRCRREQSRAKFLAPSTPPTTSHDALDTAAAAAVINATATRRRDEGGGGGRFRREGTDAARRPQERIGEAKRGKAERRDRGGRRGAGGR
jgi:hypothetical protein